MAPGGRGYAILPNMSNIVGREVDVTLAAVEESRYATCPRPSNLGAKLMTIVLV